MSNTKTSMTKPKLNPKRKFVRVLWTADEEAYLRQHYPDTKTRTIADHLGRSLRKVYAKSCGMDLYKSDAFLASKASGRMISLMGHYQRTKAAPTTSGKGVAK